MAWVYWKELNWSTSFEELLNSSLRSKLFGCYLIPEKKLFQIQVSLPLHCGVWALQEVFSPWKSGQQKEFSCFKINALLKPARTWMSSVMFLLSLVVMQSDSKAIWLNFRVHLDLVRMSYSWLFKGGRRNPYVIAYLQYLKYISTS